MEKNNEQNQIGGITEIIRSRSDFVTNVERALEEIDPKWNTYPGLIVVGSHHPELIEEKISRIQWARKEKIPFLGICFGQQLAIIEFCRNILDIPDATSEEFDEGTTVITKLPKLRVGLQKVKERMESHWHNYRIDPGLVPQLRKYFDLWVSDDGVVEEMQLMDHPFFFLTAYHPEYQSSSEHPHQVLLNFLTAAKECQ